MVKSPNLSLKDEYFEKLNKTMHNKHENDDDMEFQENPLANNSSVVTEEKMNKLRRMIITKNRDEMLKLFDDGEDGIKMTNKHDGTTKSLEFLIT